MSIENATPVSININTAPLHEPISFRIEGQLLPATAKAAANLIARHLFTGDAKGYVEPSEEGGYDTAMYGGDSGRFRGYAIGAQDPNVMVATAIEANFCADGFWRGVVGRLRGDRPGTNVHVIPRSRQEGPSSGFGEGIVPQDLPDGSDQASKFARLASR